MSQQYPQNPGYGPPQQQPGWGTPQQQPTQWGAPNQQPQPGWGAPPPPLPPKKSSTGKIVGLGCAGIVALFVIIGIFSAALSGDSDDSSKGSTVSSEPTAKDEPAAETPAEDTPAEDAPEEKAPAKSQAGQFKDCVAKSGTATEKSAVKHVTKVTGADEQNDILDAAEVFTDYTGGLVGPHASDGKLIASAFASCYESENGLVTVYDKSGEILSNGNF
ncbi:hypothetical protein [Streptomyces yerevanensis]|uniref:hypothetical protein n=1 Tax=Streptomyces yerevanensis TaxID=66378 RepID=UPI00068BF37A|nr:hypothetical protein [Streptomyces yerevanensis]